MQFEGLQGLLKKKKKTASDAEVAKTTADSSTSPTSTSTVSASDPYAAALQRALQQQQQQLQPHNASDAADAVSVPSSAQESRKRSRESSADAHAPESSQTDKSNTVNPQEPGVTVPTSATTAAAVEVATCPLPVKVLKTAEEIRTEQQRGVAVLLRCRTALEQYWAQTRLTQTLNSASAQTSDVTSPTVSQLLPASVARYLVKHFVSEQRVSAATGEPEVALVERECVLLSELHAEVMEGKDDARTEAGATDSSDGRCELSSAATSAELQKLGETVRVLWYLIALRWQFSLDPCQIASATNTTAKAVATASTQALSPDQQGWSHYVYLALHGALPPDARLTVGRAIGQEVDRWRALTRTRQFALELLAYLHTDFRTMQSMSGASAQDARQACIVPADLRDSLHAMLVHHLQRERNYMAVRQDYVDVTMGTANWKLGLFSGGEVHMRRSMERVERNRIHHLLNNEHATHLLQSVRELTTFVEQQKAASMEEFFVSPLPK